MALSVQNGTVVRLWGGKYEHRIRNPLENPIARTESAEIIVLPMMRKHQEAFDRFRLRKPVRRRRDENCTP